MSGSQTREQKELLDCLIVSLYPMSPVNLQLKTWIGQRPFVIAGPCGVESEAQIHAIASALRGTNVHLLRGGIWKPRTRPDSFHGIGTEGLRFLKEAGKENGFPVCVEVASPMHVEEALEHSIDVLWIGARTTVNPFLVQEIANSLKGVRIPVMVKNPINPDLELWIGALERLNRSGIEQLMAIHRGFSSFEKTRYRNTPNWPLPIELKRRFPSLPLICDPSHICGSRPLIPSVAQNALDLNYDGLMIEVHNHPESALSDKEQQLTPAAFNELIDSLVIRNEKVDDRLFLSVLEEFRDRIDSIDEQILQLMGERMNLARSIGHYKKENNMTIYQVERWNEILITRQRSGSLKELDLEFIFKLYQLIHDESIRLQTGIMNSSEAKNVTE